MNGRTLPYRPSIPECSAPERRRGRSLVRLLLAALGVAVLPAAANEKGAYDRAFEALMERYHLPGLAVGVIEHGQVAWMRTAGELAADSGKPVTPDTLF